MDIDRRITRDYVIGREGEALLAADLNGEAQSNPEVANEPLIGNADPGSSEFDDIHMDSYTEACAAGIRDRMV